MIAVKVNDQISARKKKMPGEAVENSGLGKETLNSHLPQQHIPGDAQPHSSSSRGGHRAQTSLLLLSKQAAFVHLPAQPHACLAPFSPQAPTSCPRAVFMLGSQAPLHIAVVSLYQDRAVWPGWSRGGYCRRMGLLSNIGTCGMLN